MLSWPVTMYSWQWRTYGLQDRRHISSAEKQAAVESAICTINSLWISVCTTYARCTKYFMFQFYVLWWLFELKYSDFANSRVLLLTSLSNPTVPTMSGFWHLYRSQHMMSVHRLYHILAACELPNTCTRQSKDSQTRNKELHMFQ